MSISSFRNRNKRRDKKTNQKRHGMRVDDSARKLAVIISNKKETR